VFELRAVAYELDFARSAVGLVSCCYSDRAAAQGRHCGRARCSQPRRGGGRWQGDPKQARHAVVPLFVDMYLCAAAQGRGDQSDTERANKTSSMRHGGPLI
jgi:hypothetical protein